MRFSLRNPVHRLGILCLAAAAIVGGCSYRPGVTKEYGDYIRFMPAPPERVSSVAKQVLAEMKFMAFDEGSKGGKMFVVSRNFQDTRITVTSEASGQNASKVSVNVSPGENEGLSMQVLNELQKRLE